MGGYPFTLVAALGGVAKSAAALVKSQTQCRRSTAQRPYSGKHPPHHLGKAPRDQTSVETLNLDGAIPREAEHDLLGNETRAKQDSRRKRRMRKACPVLPNPGISGKVAHKTRPRRNSHLEHDVSTNGIRKWDCACRKHFRRRYAFRGGTYECCMYRELAW